MIIISIIASTICLYCILAIILKVPIFSTRRARSFTTKTKQDGFITKLNRKFASYLTPFINPSIMKKSNIKKLLRVVNSNETPEEFLAKGYALSAFAFILVPVFYLLNKPLALIPLIIVLYIPRYRYKKIEDAALKKEASIESELIKFVMYMASAIKSEKNIINCMEQYKLNFDTPLTDELEFTLAEMRVGSYEKALRNMSHRNNSSSITKLCDGLISALNGNDMSIYFFSLSLELESDWEARLRQQVLDQEPKISRMSLLLFALATLTIFIVLIFSLTSSTSILF